jgi:hypothetical protein
MTGENESLEDEEDFIEYDKIKEIYDEPTDLL